jgi:hypothetical protein
LNGSSNELRIIFHNVVDKAVANAWPINLPLYPSRFLQYFKVLGNG